MLTDTIPTPGWWLLDNRNAARLAQPFTNQERLSQFLYSDGSCACMIADARIVGHTHSPEAVLAWVRDGVLP